MKNALFILQITFLFSVPNQNDWVLPISVSDYGWFPLDFVCVDENGSFCNDGNELACNNLDCIWATTECGGIYGGYEENGICHGLSDTINIGLSDSAAIGFRYGEDEINLTPSESLAPFVDGYFFHPEWYGTVDVNNIFVVSESIITGVTEATEYFFKSFTILSFVASVKFEPLVGKIEI